MDAEFFQQISMVMKDMLRHCQAGMKVLDGDSAKSVLTRKERLLHIVENMDVQGYLENPQEFEDQRRDFVSHVREFQQYHNLPDL